MDLKRILDDHKLWLDNKGGARANLYEADLRGVDLSGAYLSRANLREANFSGADLWRANLSGADFREADLSGANLSGANLAGAIVKLTPDVMKAIGLKN